MKTAVAVAVLTMVLAPAASVAAQTTPLPAPPDAYLASASSSEVKGEIQMYCWREPDPNGGFLGVCADDFNPITPAQSVSVVKGQPLTLRFDRPIRPDRITVTRREGSTASPPIESFEVPADNPTQFVADFPVGTYVISVSTTWEQGDATYVFTVAVVDPLLPGAGIVPPQVLAAIDQVRNAAESLRAGSGPFEQRLNDVLSSSAALLATLRSAFNLPAGA
jgi:hypothetical protein